MRHVRSRLPATTALVVAAALAAAACGDDDDLADARAEQVREAATEAGLPADVVDVMVLAARGTSATYQVTYDGDDGAAVLVSQQPPDRRVDVLRGDRVVESRVVRDGTGYECRPPEGDPEGALRCRRTESALEAPGAFTDEALDEFAAQLGSSQADLDLTVEEQEIAGVTATCLTAERRAGAGGGPASALDTLCLSPEGAPLLVEAEGERVVASAYSADVPDGTFDV